MSYILQEARLGQHTTLSPRLQQSVKLLQMSAQEFSATLEQAISSNPFLEQVETPNQEDPDEISPVETSNLAEANAQDATPSAVILGDDHSQRDVRESASRHRAENEQVDYAEMRASQAPTLTQLLSGMLGMSKASRRQKLLAAFIIDALEEDGYLRTAFDDLIQVGDISPSPTPEEWERALKIVQTLDAPGLGARTIGECLCLQLDAAASLDRSTQKLAKAIVMNHLELLAAHDDAQLKHALACNDEQLRIACDTIRALDPKPGRRFSPEHAAYVVADVTVRKRGAQWEVSANRAASPQARLHGQYAEMYRRAGEKGQTPMARELQEARWLVRNAEQRYVTIARVAQAIVSRQLRFFDYGDIALRPLMLKDIADQLSLHESTISRATANKYMLTPLGLYEFRYFFSRELATDLGGTCSARAVKSRIRSHIYDEDPSRPLSDVALRRVLADEGIVLARRTVSKYRSELRLACADARRMA
jgi:RNA polymerase sigma-54 factor